MVSSRFLSNFGPVRRALKVNLCGVSVQFSESLILAVMFKYVSLRERNL